MESENFHISDPRQAYDIPSVYSSTLTHHLLYSIAGSGKSVLWYVIPQLLLNTRDLRVD